MAKEQTLVLPAVTKEDKQLIADVERMLLRQTGGAHPFQTYKDDKGLVWAAVSWDMTRADKAVVAMLQRRGVKPVDEAGQKTKALLAETAVAAKPLSKVKTEMKLTWQAAVAVEAEPIAEPIEG